MAIKHQKFIFFNCVFYLIRGCAVAQLVEAWRCTPEGSGLSSRWGHWNFS